MKGDMMSISASPFFSPEMTLLILSKGPSFGNLDRCKLTRGIVAIYLTATQPAMNPPWTASRRNPIEERLALPLADSRMSLISKDESSCELHSC